MNKRITIMFILIFSAMIAALLLYRITLSDFAPTKLAPTPTPTPTHALEEIMLPVDIFLDSKSLNSSFHEEYSSNLRTITFDGVPGGYRTQAVEIKMDGQELGRTHGSVFWEEGFSPNDKYFLFYTGQYLSCCYLEYRIGIVSFDSSRISYIDPPLDAADYSGSLDATTIQIFPAVDALTWITSSAIQLESYLVAPIYDESKHSFSEYRVSPKEIWEYDLETGEYTFIKELPEEM